MIKKKKEISDEISWRFPAIQYEHWVCVYHDVRMIIVVVVLLCRQTTADVISVIHPNPVPA